MVIVKNIVQWVLLLKQGYEMNQQNVREIKSGDKYDIIIIGAGIGGILTAANLVGTHQKICVIEKLGFAGGRFTSIPYQGFSISTGAIHLLPHGSNGPMGKMLWKLIK